MGSPMYTMQGQVLDCLERLPKGAAAKRRYRLENYNLKLSVIFQKYFGSRNERWSHLV